MKNKLISLILLSCACFSICNSNTQEKEIVFAKEANEAVENSDILETLTNSEYLKLADGLNISKYNTPVSMGTNSKKIFNYQNENFRNDIMCSAKTSTVSDSAIGSSSAEISKSYEQNFGMNLGAGVELPIPYATMGLDVSAAFEMDIKSELTTINDEYYEIWELTKITKLAQINWESKDVDMYFSDVFISDLENIVDVFSAKKFLEDYGTHVFDNYYLGGKLYVSTYACSETSVSESYATEKSEVSLKANIESVMNADIGSSNSYIADRQVNTSNTRTDNKVWQEGGQNLDGVATPDHLFQYREELGQGESRRSYDNWLDSIDDGKALSIVKVEKPTAIWDLIRKSKYHDDKKYDLLQSAFELLAYENYSTNCEKNNISPSYIDTISYSVDEMNIQFDLENNEVSLPENVSATLQLGSYLTEAFEEEDVELVLKSGKDYAVLEGTNLTVKENAYGKKLTISILVKGNELYDLTIDIKRGSFRYGYGTINQPYLIGQLSEWRQMISDTKYYNSHFELTNDINLKGDIYSAGGSTTNSSFFGYLNGNNYTIKNATIVSNEAKQNTGLFASNYGVIKNLYLDGIKVLNSKLIAAKNNGNINVGILAGVNKGEISCVGIKNSSVRIASSLDGTSSLNVGGLVGANYSKISQSFVSNMNLSGITYNGSGKVNVGGLIGKNAEGSVDNCYVVHSNNNVTNYYNNNEEKTSQYNLGGIIGMVEGTDKNKSKIDFCIAYDIYLNKKEGSFGHIAGNSTKHSFFQNCYYEGTDTTQVNGTQKDGCTNYRILSLDAIGNYEMNEYWTSNEENKPILKWEEQ